MEFLPEFGYFLEPDSHMNYRDQFNVGMGSEITLTKESSETSTTPCGFEVYYEFGTVSWTNSSDELKEHPYAAAIVKIPVADDDDVDLWICAFDNTDDNSKSDIPKELVDAIADSVLRFEY